LVTPLGRPATHTKTCMLEHAHAQLAVGQQVRVGVPYRM
jgi:hypothetical protein